METLGTRYPDGVVADGCGGRIPLANGTSAKALTGIDDHSRMCVCARLMVRERTRAVCDGLREALATYGAPEQILTDNGKVFTGRFNHPPVEVLFDAICREHGIEHLLTQPRTPTTTGKIERFHRSLRAEFLRTAAPFANLRTAQAALDAWVCEYNTVRPHQSLKMATPAERFTAGARVSPAVRTPAAPDERGGQDWVSRTVTTNGVVCVSWQQVSVGRHYAGHAAMCTSTVGCCGSGSATNSSKPLPAPAPARYETNGPSAPAHRPKPQHQSVKDQPKQIRQPSTDSQQPHFHAV